MEKKVKLSVLGFSFNRNNTGAYGLVLAEEDGLRRLIVVIGTPEAQAIAFQLQSSAPPRPLTHDLLCALLKTFDINVVEIVIYDYIDGVFYSKIRVQQGSFATEVESRTSDAINVALRTNAPIYTTQKIMDELAVVFDEDNKSAGDETEQPDLTSQTDYSLFDDSEIKRLLAVAIADENYEQASILRDELKRRKI